MNGKIIITILMVFFLTTTMCFVVVRGSTDDHPVLESEKLGVIEGCEVYRIKVGVMPRQLLWRCK